MRFGLGIETARKAHNWLAFVVAAGIDGRTKSRAWTLRRRLVNSAAILLVLLTVIARAPAPAFADASTALTNRVNRAFAADNRLNGAMCYVPAPGVVVLHGQVFDPRVRDLAESTASNVRGVTQVINGLTTTTGEWIEEQARINDTLQLNGFQDVSARVVGSTAYLSGTVTGESEKQRAARVVTSISNLQIINMIWAKPGPVF
jgi:BON domain